MADGLAAWDAFIARVEGGLAAEIGGAPPATAARMRMALGAVYLERGRVDAALTQLDAAAALDPASPDIQVFRGMALERAARPADAAAAFHQAWQLDRTSAVNAYRYLRAVRGAPAPPDVAQAANALLRRRREPGRAGKPAVSDRHARPAG